MKLLIPGMLLLLAQATVVAQNKDISLLKQLNNDWINCYPSKDTATLHTILADDMVLVSPGGLK